MGFNGRRPKKQPQKQQNAAAHKTGKAAQRSRSSNINRKSKMQQHKQQKAETTGKSAQTTRAAQAEASCTNNKEHQTATTREEQQHKQQQKQHKQQQKQRTKRNIISSKCSTSSSKSCTNSTNSSENSKSSNRDEGPEGGASLCSQWRLLVEFLFFQAFFEIQVNFTTIGY